MDALTLRSTPLRTAFTKAVNHLQEIIEKDPVDMNAVETAFEQLKIKSAKLKEVEDAVLELMIESNCTQEAYNIEFEAIESYAEKMIAWQVHVKNIMKTDALGQKGNPSLVTSSSSSLRLPKVQFQQFSGKLTDWLRFHNQFKRIHEDESIDDGDKFQYLIQATTPKSRARDIVESFPATPENYRKAFGYLRMRFGQEDVLIQVYVRELLKLVLQNTEVKKVNLSSLYDKIEAQLRALESLGVTKEKYAAMLFPLVESCLPAEILHAWERYVGYSSNELGKKDLDSLMKFLSIDVSSEDRIKLARNSFDSEKFDYISGRYEVALPWAVDNKLLSCNRKLAENRLESTKRKLIATGKFEEYQNVLDLWLSEKITEEVNDDKKKILFLISRIGPLLKKTAQVK
ncbi:integrase catalytic domain-containing protein [Trichonephila clavipes]|nr:integrase catalytic domain-containing protein [Trichonephila clavipes]